MVDFLLSAHYGTRDLWPDQRQLHALGLEMKRAGVPTDKFALGHLWFLYYLCYFYLLLPLCGFLAERSRRHQTAIQRLLASPWMLPALGLVTAASLWTFPDARVFKHFIFIEPHLPSMAYYGSFFVLGYLFHAHRSVLEVFARSVRWSAPLALALFVVSSAVSELDQTTLPRALPLHLLAVVLNGTCTWALIYAFIGGALRWFDRGTPWVLYVSQSSYWVFLAHLPLVCLAAWIALPWDTHAVFKFAWVVGFTSLVCFVSYHTLVQRSWVSVFLNGRRFDLDWPWRAQGMRGA